MKNSSFVLLFCVAIGLTVTPARVRAVEVPVPVPSPQKGGSEGRAFQTDGKEVISRPNDLPEQEHQQSPERDETAATEKLPANLTFKTDPTCEGQLKELGVVYQLSGPIKGGPGCGFSVSYNVTEISPGVVIEPATQLRCETVLAMARWVKDFVEPAFEARFQLQNKSLVEKPDRLAKIKQASTYVCRRRNNQPDGKLSWHSIGAALDISSFESASGKVFPVKPRGDDDTADAALQKTLQSSACLHFTTVLGPGSDGYHEDHLHLDIAQRRGDFRLCK